LLTCHWHASATLFLREIQQQSKHNELPSLPKTSEKYVFHVLRFLQAMVDNHQPRSSQVGHGGPGFVVSNLLLVTPSISWRESISSELCSYFFNLFYYLYIYLLIHLSIDLFLLFPHLLGYFDILTCSLHTTDRWSHSWWYHSTDTNTSRHGKLVETAKHQACQCCDVFLLMFLLWIHPPDTDHDYNLCGWDCGLFCCRTGFLTLQDCGMCPLSCFPQNYLSILIWVRIFIKAISTFV